MAWIRDSVLLRLESWPEEKSGGDPWSGINGCLFSLIYIATSDSNFNLGISRTECKEPLTAGCIASYVTILVEKSAAIIIVQC